MSDTRSATLGAGTAVPGRTWHADEVAGTHGVHLSLSAADAAEIDAALQGIRRRGTPLLSIGRGDFPLPTLAADLARVAESLEAVPGFVRISGVPALEHHSSALRTLCWGLASQIGTPVSQDTHGRMLHQIRPATAALHTCGSDAVVFMAAADGVEIDLVSSEAIHAEVSRWAPRLAGSLFDPFALAQGGVEAGMRPRMVPLACRYAGKLSLRYDRSAIEAAQAIAGVPALTADQAAVLDLVDEVARDPGLRRQVHLQAGDVLLINNYAVLHGLRSGRACEAGPAALLRLWLTLPNGRPLPDGYTWPTPTYGRPPGRGGVDPLDVVHDSHPVGSLARLAG